MQPQDKSEIDTSIAPTGGVQEKASAFSTPKVKKNYKELSLSHSLKAKSPAKLNCPKIKRSESSLESDMQKKYQQQLASTALKRGNSTAALVVKKEGNETVLKVDKVAKNLTVDDDITVGFFTFVPTCLSANFVRTTCRGSTSSSWQAQH